MVVAVAGGTGGVGKTIVQQLQLHRERFKVLVLTRTVSEMTRGVLNTVWHFKAGRLPHQPAFFIPQKLVRRISAPRLGWRVEEDSRSLRSGVALDC